MPALPRWVSLSIVFLLTVAVLACLGQEVGRTFGRFAPLEAYRLDVLGSLAGIALFAGVSFLRLPPLGWAVLVAAAFVPLLGRRLLPVAGVGVALVVLLLGAQSLLGGYFWSPYYKIRAVTSAEGSVKVDVNNTPHQTAHRLSQLDDSDPFYRYPYTYAGARDDVLIIGAGTGNDVAVALSEGAKRVDAVEIDPVLQQLGKDRHPERPYADPRVVAHVDDGRAFLERTNRRYDLILLALPDSATIVTGQARAAAGELPVHHRGADPGAVAAQAGRHVRDVQLLRELARRPVREHDPGRVRRAAVRPRRPVDRRPPGGGAEPARGRQRRRLHHDLAAVDEPGAAAHHRRPALPLPGRPHDPALLPGDAGADPGPRRSCWCGSRPARCGRCARTSTCSSWAARSCCWRRRTWCSSRCCSAPPGWSTPRCSPACCCRCWPRSRPRGGSGCRGRCCSTSDCSPRWCWPGSSRRRRC